MPKQIISQACTGRARKTSFSLLIIAFIITGLTASAWAWIAIHAEPTASANRAEAAILTAPTSSSSSQDRVEAEIITIRPTGFDPAEITRSKGRFILIVNNRSWLKEVQLQLVREGGNLIREVRGHRNKPDWREMVDLPPGQYVLKEANHPDWACRIIIASQ